jgi:NAD(P)-dependent dehydrogenase (short-subunit alcohol dehydrogenase family)
MNGKDTLMASLEGKSAIVTGGARGIGKAIALELAGAGVDVLVCARSDREDPSMPGTIGQTAREIEALGRKAVALRVDLMNDDDNRAMVDKALAEFGKIDILVNNAVYVSFASFLESPIEDLDAAFRVNVRAPYLSSKLVAPSMIANGGGAIFNISSGAARHPVSGAPTPARLGMNTRPNATYGPTKAALDRYTTGLAPELAAHNIAIVSVDPGFTNTERTRSWVDADFDMSVSQSPETTAKAIAFMAREPMAYSGQVVVARDLAAEKSL